MKIHPKVGARRKSGPATKSVPAAARHRAKAVGAARKTTVKASAPAAAKAVKTGGKPYPMEEAEELYRNTGKSVDEDSTGGDDADDGALANLRNDPVDSSTRKRDSEERFAKEQKLEDDDKARRA